MTDLLDLAYFAGLLDGEGTVSAAYVTNAKGDRGLHLIVTMSNTDAALVAWVHESFGGRTTMIPARKPTHKPLVRWELSSADQIDSLLTPLIPLLRVKQRQAEIVLALCKLSRRRGQRHIRVTDEERAHRDIQIVELRRLNRRGA